MYVSDEDLEEERAFESAAKWWPVFFIVAAAAYAYALINLKNENYIPFGIACFIFLISAACVLSFYIGLTNLRRIQRKRLAWYDEHCRQQLAPRESESSSTSPEITRR